MKIRLHEIELGSSDVSVSTSFLQTTLGLTSRLEQEELTVFDAGVNGIDFNISSHFPQGITALSFLTDDLSEVEGRLKEEGIMYQGPMASHLGMSCIRFTSPDGYVIKVNTAGPESPSWLKV